ncbi:CocE/NonD family hydrolase [Ferruginibacter sp. SUN106]|uniref:CocE/NonD family hydrolase n=1 Tax=Ferruginibacter sp. SUN106 TaxID=2978348 RepID=UPI003D361E0D
MKKILLLLITIACSHYNIFCQTKPELPLDFFDGFSYTLPADFNYNDSEQLNTVVKKMAAELLKWQITAGDKYTISDSTQLYFFLDATAALNSFFGNNQQAIDAIIKARSLRPTPVYSIPFRLSTIAYSNACLLHADDGSAAFKEVFLKSLKEQYNSLNPDFKNDIINQQKGSFTLTAAPIAWKNLTRILDQSIKSTNGKMNYSTAYTTVTQFQSYYRLKNYQPVFEQALYAISSARVKEETIAIPMRDGIKLNAYLYKNEVNTEQLPAIISLSPYPSGNEARNGNVFATNGYVYVYVDTRGRRASEGIFMPYEHDAKDYYDIIDWVSKQPWCNGKVATTGGSYLGFDQWQTIRKQYKHPALKAINPMVSVGFGVDFPRRGNQFYPYILQWATFVSGKELNQALFDDWQFWNDKNYELYKNRIPFAKLDSVIGMPNPVFQKWLSHPDFDSYWQNILPAKKDYEAIDIPILSITGYYDADQVGALYYYNQHQKYGSAKAKDNHYLLIGPYDHGGAQWQPGNIQGGVDIEKEAQVPIYKYVIWWFDWVLKGKTKPAFLKDKITYFETGNNTWKGTSALKKITTDSLELFLSPAIVPNAKRKDLHLLDDKKPVGTNTIKYKHDIAMALDSAFLFSPSKPYDDSLYMTSPYNLVFESRPLEQDIVITDKIISRIYATLNVPDADFEMAVEEVAADGKDRSLASGIIRVRYRNGDEKPQLAKPGEIVVLNFDDIFLYIKKVSKGSKLRFIFQSSNNPWAEKNFGFGGEVSKETTTNPRIIEATILMGNKFASKIVVPYTTN